MREHENIKNRSFLVLTSDRDEVHAPIAGIFMVPLPGLHLFYKFVPVWHTQKPGLTVANLVFSIHACTGASLQQVLARDRT